MRIFSDIPFKHRVQISGSYNASVYICNACGHELSARTGETLHANIVGFASTNAGVMMVVECPSCFEKWHCHARLRRADTDRDSYDFFLMMIQDGIQKFHKH